MNKSLYKVISYTFLLGMYIGEMGTPAFALPIWSGEYGESSFQLLKLRLSPRTAALNGSGVAYSRSTLEATDLNPAAAYGVPSGISLGQAYPFKQFEAKIPHVSFMFPIWSGNLFFGSRFLGFQNIRGFSENDRETTSYGAHTLKVQVGYALEWHKIRFGLGLGYALNNIENHDFHTAIMDLGFQYVWKYGLHFGASVTSVDLWTSQGVGGGKVYPPNTFQGGIGYTQTWKEDFKGALLLDVRKRQDERVNLPIGLELSWKGLLIGRLGYVWEDVEQESGWTFGGGLYWGGYSFDYALATHKNLGAAHYLTFSIEY